MTLSKKTMLLALLLCISAIGFAQTKEEVLPGRVIDGIRKKFWTIQRASMADKKERERKEKEMTAELEKILDEAIAKLKIHLANMKKEEERMKREYTSSYKHQPGEMNLFPVWEEIPAPISSLTQAKATKADLLYDPYVDKVTMLMKQLGDMQREHLGDQRSSKEEIMRDSKNMANKSLAVQQMGGADALMKMNESERKAAAQNMKANMMANPGAFVGSQDPGMNEMMKKMMNDPAYRKQFEKMTNAQKKAEMQKYMTAAPVERDDAAFEASMKERNTARKAINLQLLLEKTLKQMQEAAAPVARGTEIANDFYAQVYADLNRWYDKAYDALPYTVVGETREKEGVQELQQFTAALRYQVQQMEAATRTTLWNHLKVSTKIAFGEFNDYVGSFPWGKTKNASLVDGSYNEIQVAAAVNKLYDQMIVLAKDAKKLTQNHAGQQEQYELIMGN